MRFELKTLVFDIICALVFALLGLTFFNVFALPIPGFKGIVFVISLILLAYFGIYRNHNYTDSAYRAQGLLDIYKGRVVSNLDVTEQSVDEDIEGIEE